MFYLLQYLYKLWEFNVQNLLLYLHYGHELLQYSCNHQRALYTVISSAAPHTYRVTTVSLLLVNSALCGFTGALHSRHLQGHCGQAERVVMVSGCRLEEEEREQCMMGQNGSWALRVSDSRRCSSDRESTWGPINTQRFTLLLSSVRYYMLF